LSTPTITNQKPLNLALKTNPAGSRPNQFFQKLEKTPAIRAPQAPAHSHNHRLLTSLEKPAALTVIIHGFSDGGRMSGFVGAFVGGEG
jgi:hypothetical protein